MHRWVYPSGLSREGLWRHRPDLGVSFSIWYIWVDPRGGGLLCECRDRGGIQAIVANFEEFGESRGELGEAQGRGS